MSVIPGNCKGLPGTGLNGRAEEGGEESDVESADMLEKAARRSLNQWKDTFLPVRPSPAPGLGSAVHA